MPIPQDENKMINNNISPLQKVFNIPLLYEFLEIDVMNMITLLPCIANYIKTNKVE